MKPRLLYIPLDYQLRPYKEWFDAFNRHYDCKYYTTLDEAVLFDPNIMFLHSGALSLNELKALRVNLAFSFLCQWTGDCREYLLPEVVQGKDIFDATFLACGIGQKKMYEDVLGHKVHYLQHAVAGDLKFEVRRSFEEKNIVFIGNNYDQFEGARERNELCEMLSKEFDNFKIYGNGYNDAKYNNYHSVHHSRKYELYNQSFIGISSNIFNDIEGYWSDRPLEIMAAGSCCVMRYTPKAERWFQDGVNCMFYRNNIEAVGVIKFLLANEDVRNRIAENGQRLVMKEHTYDNRVQEIINAIK